MHGNDFGVMERTEMIEILTFLYDRRLKALLCYQHTDFTRVLVEYMFRRFDEISATDEKQPMFTENVQSYIGEVLLYGTKERNQSDALLAVTNLTVVLENYIRCTAYCFWPKEMEKKEKKEKKEADNLQEKKSTNTKKHFDCRAFIGKKFGDLVRTQKDRFPEKLSQRSIVTQLRHVTDIRNQRAHPIELGYTTMFKRYEYLKAFDVLLGYLLYTFYHMIFAGDEKNMNYLNKKDL